MTSEIPRRDAALRRAVMHDALCAQLATADQLINTITTSVMWERVSADPVVADAFDAYRRSRKLRDKATR